MITIEIINSIAYYRVAEGRAGLDEFALGLNYYEDRTGSRGTLMRLAGPAPVEYDRDAGPFGSILDGSLAQFDLVERLGQGRDPRTGRRAIMPVTTDRDRAGKRSRGRGPRRVVAYDLTFSAEKVISVLALLSEPRRRDILLAIHDDAVEKTLRLAAAMGLILNRRGKQGAVRLPATESIVAVYRHLTSRDRDPQLHSHAVLFNICVRDDGSLGAIENRLLLTYKNALSALYRAELVRLLRERMGIVAIGKGIGIEIPGVPREVCELFSKRRAAVVGELNRKGLTSAENRRAAEIAALGTRPRKDSATPLSQLQQDWHAQLAGIGFDIETIWDRVEAQSERRRNLPDKPVVFQMAARSAYAELFERELTISHADILRIEAQTFQTQLAPAQILERARARQGELIGLPYLSHQLQRFMPSQAIRDEHALLKAALAARGAWAAPETAAVEAVLAVSTASSEQRDAVRHMLGPDGVCVAEGAAGTGKTHVLKLLRDILIADRRQVLVAAPAWRAARLAGQEARVALADALALDPLAAEIREGTRVIDRNTVIVVDEAGMAGSHDLQTLVEAVTAAGAKLILTGDTRQLQPVARGAPMRALIDLLGSHRLDQIRRQGLEWMREASAQFAAGNAAAGLARYAEAGAVAVHRDRETTLAACARSYLDDPSRAEPGWSTQALARRLLIAVRNEDVAELNRRVRQILMQDGQLGETAIVVDAVGRGGGDAVPVELRVGDRIMFGRRLRLEPQVFNSDVATLLSIDDSKDARIKFRLDRQDEAGRPLVLTARVSDLAVRDQAGISAAIHLQHAYAVTNYAAQGATVDVAVVAHLCAMNASNLYVACTRHRHSLRIEVDGERVLKLDRSRQAGISRAGGFRGLDQVAPTPERALTPDQVERVMNQLRREANAQPLKTNPSDHLDNVRDWLGGADPVAAFRQRMRTRSDAQILPKIDEGSAPEMTAASAPPSVQVPLPGQNQARSDPEALSIAERQRLAAILSPATCLSWFGGRLTRTGLLAHPASGYALDPRAARVGWSRRADQRLRRAGAESEPRLVQAAVVLLGKSLRQARSFVRDRAALWVLNPIARALRTQLAASWRVRLSMLTSSVVAPVISDDQADIAPSAGLRRFKAMIARTRRLAQERGAEVNRGIEVDIARTSGIGRSRAPSVSSGLDRRDGRAPDQGRAPARHVGWAAPGADPTTLTIVARAHQAGSPSMIALSGPAPFTLDVDEVGSTGARRRKTALRRIDATGREADHRQAAGNVPESTFIAANEQPRALQAALRSAQTRASGSLDPALVNPNILSEADILWKPSAEGPVAQQARAAATLIEAEAKVQTPLQASKIPDKAAIAGAAARIRVEQILAGSTRPLSGDDEHQPLGKRLRKVALRRLRAAERLLDSARSQSRAALDMTVERPAPDPNANLKPLASAIPLIDDLPGKHHHPDPPAATRTNTGYRKLDHDMINPRTLTDKDVLATSPKVNPQKSAPPIVIGTGRPKRSPGDKGPGM